MESTLAKIFQFLSGSIIIVEIVGEDGMKAAAMRSNERLQRIRARSISKRMMDDVLRNLTFGNEPKGKRTVTHKIIRVVNVLAFITALCVSTYLWPSNPNASIWERIGFGGARLLGAAFVGGIAGAAGISILVLLIRIIVIPIERFYGAMLTILGRFLEHDHVKKRLLTASFVFLVIGTTLDLASGRSSD